MVLSITITQCAPETTKFGKITQNQGHFDFQGHSKSPIHTASYTKTILIGKYCALSLEFMNLLGIYTVGVARSLCRHLLLDIVFGKITQNKSRVAVQGHSRSPILVPIESSYTTSY